jgi:hypothetical protein
MAGSGVREGLLRPVDQNSHRSFTGNLRTDLFAEASPTWPNYLSENVLVLQGDKNTTHTKSPFLAAALSAAVPGSGEFYSKSYVKSGAFFAAEIISWVVNLSYNRKGDRATREFQNFADLNWSVVEYAAWINENGRNYNPNVNCFVTIDPNTSLPPWKRVNWAELNQCERLLGGLFSHSLPPYGDQQYYELIGKYPQYNPGWADADRSHISEENISALFRSYAGMRGRANDFYNVASTAILVVVLNHILSAADAAWSASRYNAIHTEAEMTLQHTPTGVELMPKMTLSVRW